MIIAIPIIKPYIHNIEPLKVKEISAPTPLAKFNALALPAAVTKSYPKNKKPKIKNEPVQIGRAHV